MQINILGCESFGARSLACVVKTGKKDLIDPGVALARLRYGLLPHPAEVAAALRIRKKILEEFEGATDIVISHYHGDHMPMKAEDPYQLPVEALPPLKSIRLWCKGPEKISGLSARRRGEFSRFLGYSLPASEGTSTDGISFSAPVPHGREIKGLHGNDDCISDGDEVFVHSSDIQLLTGKLS
jgi:predicted metallo-beta-lactamase superfamily hydrolase